jgi:hypothetical protein
MQVVQAGITGSHTIHCLIFFVPFSDCCSGAHGLLDLRIGHRDISPGNICMATDSKDFLTDLGLSLVTNQQHWRPSSVCLPRQSLSIFCC